MPNWCHNRLRVSGNAQLLDEFADAVRELHPPEGEDAASIDFERLVPMPDEYREIDEDGNPVLGGEHGLPGWWTWRSQNWGTKWNAMYPEPLERPPLEGLRYSFLTAWSPPLPWVTAAAEQYPDLTFDIEYAEEFAHYAGRATWHKGRLHSQEELDPLEVDWVEWEETEPYEL